MNKAIAKQNKDSQISEFLIYKLLYNIFYSEELVVS